MTPRLFTQKNSVFIAIALTIFLIGTSSGLTFYGRYKAREFNAAKEKIEKADSKIEAIFQNMNDLDKGVRGFLILPEDQFLLPYRTAISGLQENFDSLKFILEEQHYPEIEPLLVAKAAMMDYSELLGQMIYLKRQGEMDQVLEIYKSDPGLPVWMTCAGFARDVREFEKERYKKAKSLYQIHLDIASVMQVLLLVIGIPTLAFVIHQIKKSERNRTQLFHDLSASRRNYLFNDGTQVEHHDERNLIDHLISDLGKAAGFIKRISEGDYAVKWEGLNEANQSSNQENLAGALVQMREQMKAVKQEDQQRLWSTEGLSKVAEITRKHQEDIEQLANTLLSYLVSYTGSNQGALFFLQEELGEEPCLVLSACYAYDKKKHSEKRIKLGQGLVGQTFLEKKTLHLTQVPQQYVSITSGLGEATPTTLLLVPLIFNEQVMGILEMAAFDKFAAHQVLFLESVGEVIASAVATVRMNSQTKVLLGQSQEGTEALRAQEEEMRQNMEELQATQEEMERKAQEYEAVIEEQQKKIQQLKQAKV